MDTSSCLCGFGPVGPDGKCRRCRELAEATATGPERDLADLERLAREYGYIVAYWNDLNGLIVWNATEWHTEDGRIVYAETTVFEYTARTDDGDTACTRADALALLEKGAK